MPGHAAYRRVVRDEQNATPPMVFPKHRLFSGPSAKYVSMEVDRAAGRPSRRYVTLRFAPKTAENPPKSLARLFAENEYAPMSDESEAAERGSYDWDGSGLFSWRPFPGNHE